MKILTIISTLLLAANVAQASQLDYGFNCTMQYQQTGSMLAGPATAGNWITDGDYMEGPLGVHSVSITKIEKQVGEAGMETYWRVEVNDEDSSVALMEVGDRKGLQFAVPVNVTGPGSEDPPEYNLLKVACDSVVFAG